MQSIHEVWFWIEVGPFKSLNSEAQWLLIDRYAFDALHNLWCLQRLSSVSLYLDYLQYCLTTHYTAILLADGRDVRCGAHPSSLTWIGMTGEWVMSFFSTTRETRLYSSSMCMTRQELGAARDLASLRQAWIHVVDPLIIYRFSPSGNLKASANREAAEADPQTISRSHLVPVSEYFLGSTMQMWFLPVCCCEHPINMSSTKSEHHVR